MLACVACRHGGSVCLPFASSQHSTFGMGKTRPDPTQTITIVRVVRAETADERCVSCFGPCAKRHTYIHTHTHRRTERDTQTERETHTHARARAQTDRQTDTHTHTHTQIHMHTLTQSLCRMVGFKCPWALENQAASQAPASCTMNVCGRCTSLSLSLSLSPSFPLFCVLTRSHARIHVYLLPFAVIVYDVAQVKIRYLFRLKFRFKSHR